jgi:hypothetical protein
MHAASRPLSPATGRRGRATEPGAPPLSPPVRTRLPEPNRQKKPPAGSVSRRLSPGKPSPAGRL